MIGQFYKTNSLQNVFKRSQLAIFALTFGICTLIFVVISIYTMETYARQSLRILTDALSERIQPAVVFNDKVTINQILSEYSEQYPIRSIQVLDQLQQEMAKVDITTQYLTPTTSILDYLFFGEPVRVKIKHDQKDYGTIIVFGNSSSMVDFFHKIFIGLSLGFFIVLMALFWFVRSIYQYLMNSIHPMVSTARSIGLEKNYQLRLPHSPIKEFQDLNKVFNELIEIVEHSNHQLQTENDKLAHQARHDELTQLPNRNYFYQTLFKMYDFSHQQHSALMFIDNNHFKAINDKYGHLAGDAVLKEMAKRLKTNLRHDDFIARLGGDEFAILLKNIKKVEHLIAISEHLLNCCKSPLYYEKTEIHFSFSIGIAFFKCSNSPEDLITAADSAMYTAKMLERHWYIAPCKDVYSEDIV
ncbi:diguanylate cyclase (GGDEF)-like protein [Acinetobacter calcoaceticus]|uniref:Diguanylate cyclase (GGDEF)-like protein n=1 Tax=Acinetobacter calcoaceticus TaxID=471 RepID=A0A4R1XJU5_ACICA|nr:diguanylate cyclase (GGDEF)-like protein [Acinetobacter calcoaceticus]